MLPGGNAYGRLCIKRETLKRRGSICHCKRVGQEFYTATIREKQENNCKLRDGAKG